MSLTSPISVVLLWKCTSLTNLRQAHKSRTRKTAKADHKILKFLNGVLVFHRDILVKFRFYIFIFNSSSTRNSWRMRTKCSGELNLWFMCLEEDWLLMSQRFCNSFPCVVSLIPEISLWIRWSYPHFWRWSE